MLLIPLLMCFLPCPSHSVLHFKSIFQFPPLIALPMFLPTRFSSWISSNVFPFNLSSYSTSLMYVLLFPRPSSGEHQEAMQHGGHSPSEVSAILLLSASAALLVALNWAAARHQLKITLGGPSPWQRFSGFSLITLKDPWAASRQLKDFLVSLSPQRLPNSPDHFKVPSPPQSLSASLSSQRFSAPLWVITTLVIPEPSHQLKRSVQASARNV